MTLSVKSWPHYVQDMFSCLAPGGYAELCETEYKLFFDDGGFQKDTAVQEYVKLLVEAGVAAGIVFPTRNDITKAMVQAGFVDLEIHTKRIHWGPWGKDDETKRLGSVMLAVLESGLEASLIRQHRDEGILTVI